MPSNKHFQQGTGLFAQLAATEGERAELVKSEPLRGAIERVREFRYRDAQALREASRVLSEKLPDTEFRSTLDSHPARGAS